MNYVIEVQTGDVPGADTESNVYLQLIGTWSDSGKRQLHRSNQDSPFEAAQVNKRKTLFWVECHVSKYPSRRSRFLFPVSR